MDDRAESAPQGAAVTVSGARVNSSHSAFESGSLQDLAADVRARSDQRNWREEVVRRVDRHRARRRNTANDGSMELQFPENEALALSMPPLGGSSAMRQAAISSNLQGTGFLKHQRMQDAVADEQGNTEEEARTADGETIPVIRQRARKIIRFPNYAVSLERPPAPRITDIELAEPFPAAMAVVAAEKASEPEQMELLPSFADIRLEEQPREDVPGAGKDLELPLHPAALLHRAGAAILDGLVMAAALAVLLFALDRISLVPVPIRTQMLAVFAGGTIFWLIFQYLFLVYGRATPGMRAAGLRLLAFEGGPASRFARRSRALALTLSAVSVGLGFAWALVDEDMLGWHDRISRTYLKSD